MPTYSLQLEGHDSSPVYVPSHEFPNDMRPGDRFRHDGWTWQITEVAAKQFEAPGEPDKTLRCIAV